MDVKKFKFPSFEEWSKNYNYKQKIGAFTCGVGITGYDTDRIKIRIAISSDENLAVVSSRIYSNTLHYCNKNDVVSIRQWYEHVTKESNIRWEKYILGTYFEN